jgi:hypothetical protein
VKIGGGLPLPVVSMVSRVSIKCQVYTNTQYKYYHTIHIVLVVVHTAGQLYCSKIRLHCLPEGGSFGDGLP